MFDIKSIIRRKALFPLFLTIVSFVLFILLYLLVTVRSIEPYYLKGLIFAVPFIGFAILTFFTYKEKLNKLTSNVISMILIVVFSVSMYFTLVFLSMDAIGNSVTNPNSYQRVLNLTDYPKNSLTDHFPNEIPENASNITFKYQTSFFGSKEFKLKFITDSSSINKHITDFSKKALYSGNIDDVRSKGYNVPSYIFNPFSYDDFPNSFTIFLLDYEDDEIKLVAINEFTNEVIFIGESFD